MSFCVISPLRSKILRPRENAKKKVLDVNGICAVIEAQNIFLSYSDNSLVKLFIRLTTQNLLLPLGLQEINYESMCDFG